ncbi:hypothetical protein SynWH8103_00542 [Synechococcus sp. WH 8103]|nr:hypothetical protein SynWH8103_00542 [Synechococcus sp. WH 8103]
MNRQQVQTLASQFTVHCSDQGLIGISGPLEEAGFDPEQMVVIASREQPYAVRVFVELPTQHTSPGCKSKASRIDSGTVTWPLGSNLESSNPPPRQLITNLAEVV